MTVVGLADQLYEVDSGWPKLPSGLTLRGVTSVAINSVDEVLVFQRSRPPILVFDGSGQFIRSWAVQAEDIHGAYIDRQGRVWIANRDAHEVLRLQSDGEFEIRLGTPHRPMFQRPFNHPADIAESPTGDLYVADGYGNSCVHRFSAEGVLKQTWGSPGDGPGQFSTPHAVWVLRDSRVLVADRENNRLQLFSSDGRFLVQWRDFYHPMDVFVDSLGRILVTDQTPRLSMLTEDGTLIGRCHAFRRGAHALWADSKGAIYLAEAPPVDSITKLVPVF